MAPGSILHNASTDTFAIVFMISPGLMYAYPLQFTGKKVIVIADCQQVNIQQFANFKSEWKISMGIETIHEAIKIFRAYFYEFDWTQIITGKKLPFYEPHKEET